MLNILSQIDLKHSYQKLPIREKNLAHLFKLFIDFIYFIIHKLQSKGEISALAISIIQPSKDHDVFSAEGLGSMPG